MVTKKVGPSRKHPPPPPDIFWLFARRFSIKFGAKPFVGWVDRKLRLLRLDSHCIGECNTTLNIA